MTTNLNTLNQMNKMENAVDGNNAWHITGDFNLYKGTGDLAGDKFTKADIIEILEEESDVQDLIDNKTALLSLAGDETELSALAAEETALSTLAGDQVALTALAAEETTILTSIDNNVVKDYSTHGTLDKAGIAVLTGGTGFTLSLGAPDPGAIVEVYLKTITSGNVTIVCTSGVSFDGADTNAIFSVAGHMLKIGYTATTNVWRVIQATCAFSA